MTYRRYRKVNLTPLWVLIAVNFVILIATYIKPGVIFGLFGLQPISFLARPWTIVTCLFVHGGMWHFIANMITLFFFGRFLCLLIGETNFLTTYFLGGILGSIFYLLIGLLQSPFSIAVGASGAVFALGGVLAMMRPKLRVFIFPIPVPLPLWAAILGGFIILALFPNVAWQAHLGGLVYGLATGYFFRSKERRLY